MLPIGDENIRPHLLSPEFFDAERNPEIRFRSTSVEGEAGDLRVTGDLSMAGIALPVEARGNLRGPVPGPAGDKVALHLESGMIGPYGYPHTAACYQVEVAESP